jgi:hypothetical protein
MINCSLISSEVITCLSAMQAGISVVPVAVQSSIFHFCQKPDTIEITTALFTVYFVTYAPRHTYEQPGIVLIPMMNKATANHESKRIRCDCDSTFDLALQNSTPSLPVLYKSASESKSQPKLPLLGKTSSISSS